MHYNIYKKFIGTNKKDLLFELSINKKIKDFCYVKNFGFVYFCNSCIGVYNEENKENIFPYIDVKNIESMYGLNNNKMLLSFDGGRQVKLLNLKEKSLKNIFAKNNQKYIELLLKNIKRKGSFVAGKSERRFFLCIPSIRKIFLYEDSILKHYIGNGNCSYSVSNDPLYCSLGKPINIFYDCNKLYISDNFNNVIRCLDKYDIKLICGHPVKKVFNNPSKLIIKDKDVLFLCDKELKKYSQNNKSLNNIFSSDNEIMFCDYNDKNIIIVEKKEKLN